ncbi:MAG: flavodoxin family protein [Alphaproteobacteria bacterium]|nr:flavodoxin family protein [Alphaproteobacteria bacterium]
MKVLMINGSGNEKGGTFTALSAVAETLKAEDVETEIVQLGKTAYLDCIACMGCRNGGKNRCVFNDDIVNRIIEKAEKSDGFVFGSPVYYAHPSGRLLSVLDRVFFAGSSAFRFKPGAAVVCARRAGTTAALDVLNKYFGINQMPIVSSTYWNMVHGKTPEEVLQDKEGLQSMHNLGKAMACLLKGIPQKGNAFVYGAMTNFIR